jgi:hypothetical protein
MRFRMLRIAWSVGCGIAAVLLIALWMRGYYRTDKFHRVQAKTWTGVESSMGTVQFWCMDESNRNYFTDHTWRHEVSMPVTYPPNYAFMRTEQGYLIRSSTWLVAIAVGAMTVVPWVGRFSVRNLLMATAVAACVLGVAVASYKN